MAFERAQQEKFVVDNYEKLNEEVAQGSGEYVNALAIIMGCSTDTHSQFVEHIRQSYGELFYLSKTGDFLDKIDEIIKNDDRLNESCKKMG